MGLEPRKSKSFGLEYGDTAKEDAEVPAAAAMEIGNGNGKCFFFFLGVWIPGKSESGGERKNGLSCAHE